MKSRPFSRSIRQIASGVWPGVAIISSVRPPRLILNPSCTGIETCQGFGRVRFRIKAFRQCAANLAGSNFRLRVFAFALRVVFRERGVHAEYVRELPVVADVIVVRVGVQHDDRASTSVVSPAPSSCRCPCRCRTAPTAWCPKSGTRLSPRIGAARKSRACLAQLCRPRTTARWAARVRAICIRGAGVPCTNRPEPASPAFAARAAARPAAESTSRPEPRMKSHDAA